jgi:hypothetical protein
MDKDWNLPDADTFDVVGFDIYSLKPIHPDDRRKLNILDRIGRIVWWPYFTVEDAQHYLVEKDRCPRFRWWLKLRLDGAFAITNWVGEHTVEPLRSKLLAKYRQGR